MFHRFELRPVDTELMPCFPRLCFRQADRSDIGLAEDRRRNAGIVHLALAVSEQSAGQYHALGKRHRRQLWGADNIAKSCNRGHGGLKVIVHNHMTGGTELNPKRLKSEAIHQRTAPGRRHHKTGIQPGAIGQVDVVVSVLALDGFDIDAKAQVHALFSAFPER